MLLFVSRFSVLICFLLLSFFFYPFLIQIIRDGLVLIFKLELVAAFRSRHVDFVKALAETLFFLKLVFLFFFSLTERERECVCVRVYVNKLQNKSFSQQQSWTLLEWCGMKQRGRSGGGSRKKNSCAFLFSSSSLLFDQSTTHKNLVSRRQMLHGFRK